MSDTIVRALHIHTLANSSSPSNLCLADLEYHHSLLAAEFILEMSHGILVIRYIEIGLKGSVIPCQASKSSQPRLFRGRRSYYSHNLESEPLSQ